MFTPFLRSEYNYDMKLVSDETGLDCQDPSLAVQDQREEVDINTIVRRFGLTGQLPDAVQAPQYADFDAVIDYHSAMNAVRSAEERFMMLPADIRARFENDPQQLLEFCEDGKNLEEARKIGLVMPAEVVPKAAEPPSKEG
ncbi:MAG: internal scaffolding protein [Microvirus sp.]|nr:MAG: internal scaffolding protein [Microvirus sp.]